MEDIHATILVDLKPTEEEIMKNLQKDARWGLKRAQRDGLVVEESTDEKDWKEFYEAFKELAKEEDHPQRPLEEVKGNTKAFLICKKDSKVIAWAGISLREIKCPTRKIQDIYNINLPRLYFNVSLDEYLKFQPNNLLYWHCILWSKKNNHEYFDFGGWQINAKTLHLIGINKFKEKWGKVIYYKRDYPFHIAIGRKLVRNSKFLWRLNKWKKKSV